MKLAGKEIFLRAKRLSAQHERKTGSYLPSALARARSALRAQASGITTRGLPQLHRRAESNPRPLPELRLINSTFDSIKTTASRGGWKEPMLELVQDLYGIDPTPGSSKFSKTEKSLRKLAPLCFDVRSLLSNVKNTVKTPDKSEFCIKQRMKINVDLRHRNEFIKGWKGKERIRKKLRSKIKHIGCTPLTVKAESKPIALQFEQTQQPKKIILKPLTNRKSRYYTKENEKELQFEPRGRNENIEPECGDRTELILENVKHRKVEEMRRPINCDIEPFDISHRKNRPELGLSSVGVSPEETPQEFPQVNPTVRKEGRSPFSDIIEDDLNEYLSTNYLFSPVLKQCNIHPF